MTDQMLVTAAALTKRGFKVYCAETSEEAAMYVLGFLNGGDVRSVGIGGSVTIQELHITDAIKAAGIDVHWHWLGQGAEAFSPARQADLYLCSANAVTTDGLIVNTDGTGNRVASMIHGPKQVVAVVGCNKIVEGGTVQAIARIKREACPRNARRLGLSTPCATTGFCNPQACESGMCNVLTVLEHPTGKRPFHVVLVNEELGY